MLEESCGGRRKASPTSAAEAQLKRTRRAEGWDTEQKGLTREAQPTRGCERGWGENRDTSRWVRPCSCCNTLACQPTLECNWSPNLLQLQLCPVTWASKHVRLQGRITPVTVWNWTHPIKVFHRSAFGGYRAPSSIPKLMSRPNLDFSSHLRNRQAVFHLWKMTPVKDTVSDISQVSVLATFLLLFPHACFVHLRKSFPCYGG